MATETEIQTSSGLYAPSEDYVVPAERIGGSFWALWVYWWVVALVVAVAVGAALAISLSTPKKYQATAKVLIAPAEPIDIIDQTTGGTRSLDPTADLNTGVQLVALHAVGQAVRAKLGLSMSTNALLGEVNVAAIANSNVIGISDTNRSASRAAAIANAVARGYVDFRRTTARALYLEAADTADAQVAALPPAQQKLPQWRALSQRATQLRIAGILHTGGAQVVDYASRPTSPASPNTRTTVLVAAVIGLFLGCVFAIGLARLRRPASPPLRDPAPPSAP
jgi:uncharacterized protein involved in exopolysaccharide biosynthesis